MPLSKDVLGLALYNRRKAFDDRDINDLISEYGTLEGVRLAIAKGDAEEIINHFKTSALVLGNGLVAPPGGGTVTGAAQIT